MFLLAKVRAWYPERAIRLVGDGGYAVVELVAFCQRQYVTLISRLRADAQLQAFAGEQSPHKCGPKSRARLRSLARCLPTLQAYDVGVRSLDMADRLSQSDIEQASVCGTRRGRIRCQALGTGVLRRNPPAHGQSDS